MKSIINLLVFILLLSIFGCVTSPPSGSGQKIESSSSSTSVKLATVPSIDELDIAIRDASDYLNENIPKGSKIVILNIQSASHDLSDYIIDELIANAVNDKKFTVVDRQQLDAIRSEQNFQLSGEVDDTDALAIGKFFGAQTIVSGAVNRLGTGYRIRIRALEVKTAQVQGQYNRNIAASQTINSLLASGDSSTGSSTTDKTTVANTSSTNSTINNSGIATSTSRNEVNMPLTVGIMVPGNSLTEKLSWLQRGADSHNTYIIEVNSDESISPNNMLYYKGTINITIVLRGDNQNRTIRLSSHGSMFRVVKDITFILENNITLQGHSGNNRAIVEVYGGTFKMQTGSVITGNTNTNKFNSGGGVYVSSASTFEMSGGSIFGNIASEGGGVFIHSGTFTMTGGEISKNIAHIGGGIYSKTWSIFNMRGGTITGNRAENSGGGLFFSTSNSTLNKTGGTITGYGSDPNNGNMVGDDSGPIARKGHAVFATDNIRKETTAGPGANLFLGKEKSGVWDN